MTILFQNTTSAISLGLGTMTQNITGSLFLSLLIIILLLMMVALLFRIPIEATVVLIIPLMLVFMAATSDFLAIGGVFLIYLGIILAKNFLIR